MITQIKEKITQIFTKDYIIGLDIGTNSIKLAQFIKKEDGLHLVKADLKEIKQSEDSTLREKETVNAVRSLTKGIDIRKSKIIATVNSSRTAVKITKAPYMPKPELRDGITLQAKNYFPFSIDDSNIDYEVLGDVVDKGVRKYEILVSVSPKKTVGKYLSLLEKAGIKPVSLVPSPYALYKAIENSAYAKKGSSLAAIDIGEFHTELVITKNHEFVFSRKIPVAGCDITKAMTGVLVSQRGRTELSPGEAEKIKREVGIPSGPEEKIIENKISTTQILSMIRTPLEQLVNEIERCFDYYREETGGGKIDSLILFGGTSSLSGLVKFISDSLGVDVKLGENNSHLMELALGAAMTEGRGINLLPPEIKEKTKNVIRRGTIEAALTAAILIAFLVYIGMTIKLGSLEKRIAVAQKEISSLKPQVKKAEAQNAVQMVLVDEPHWEDVLMEISNVIPQALHLTDMRMEGGVITIKGIVSSREEGEELLSNFIISLEKGIFKNVKLVKTRELEDKSASEFELLCSAE